MTGLLFFFLIQLSSFNSFFSKRLLYIRKQWILVSSHYGSQQRIIDRIIDLGMFFRPDVLLNARLNAVLFSSWVRYGNALVCGFMPS